MKNFTLEPNENNNYDDDNNFLLLQAKWLSIC